MEEDGIPNDMGEKPAEGIPDQEKKSKTPDNSPSKDHQTPDVPADDEKANNAKDLKDPNESKIPEKSDETKEPKELGEGQEPVRQDSSPDMGEEGISRPHFSWMDAHPVIVVVLAGRESEDQQAFAIQKDFLCAKSVYFRRYFQRSQENLENVIKFPDVTPESFGFVQHYLFTGEVYPTVEHLPGYEVLINIWKVGHDLGIDGLCEKTLEAMRECRHITQHIPATPLLVQVWNDTPEGSTIRQLLLGWAAEYMRSSDSRAEFAKSLPKEVLSELVVAMSSLDMPPPPALTSSELPGAASASSVASVPTRQPSVVTSPVSQHLVAPAPSVRKNVHYMTPDAGVDVDDGDYGARMAKKTKRAPHGLGGASDKKPSSRKSGGRQSLAKQAKKKKLGLLASFAPGQEFPMDKKLEFCADLLTRMLSGPGFWTRLVGPFKSPVIPDEDGVPDYFEKVKRPMDLGTIKAKMDRGGYVSDAEFAADIRQIFTNCYTYWKEGDAMWGTCVKFEKTFEERYSEMNKWLAKMAGQEGDEHA